MDWRQYTISTRTWGSEGLRAWSWLVRGELLFFSLFGDAFLRDQDDQLLIVDMGFGELIETGRRCSELDAAMAEPETLEEWLRPTLVDELAAAGICLRDGECYGFGRRPPILGGKYERANLEPITLDVHHSMLGQLHQQAARMPPGTRIAAIEVVGQDE